MKAITLTVGLLLMLGTATGCGRDGTIEHGDKSNAPSPSSTEGATSHTFEGDGNDDDYVDSEPVELYGQYTVKWEVTGNGTDENQGNIDIQLEGGDGFDIVATNVANGSGTKKIQADYPTKYNASVYSWTGAHWTITLTRTCAGIPPDCPPLKELFGGIDTSKAVSRGPVVGVAACGGGRSRWL